ncbi:MAG: glycoside hydrolase family 3 C-terminal domain-containing protein [Bacilli bacterium]
MSKKIFKRKGFITWASVSGGLLALTLVGSILAMTTFSTLLNFAFGFGGNIYKEGSLPSYEGKFSVKEESLKNGNETNIRVCEEGMVLLKNKNNALPIRTCKSDELPASSAPKVTVFGKNSVNAAIGGTGSSAMDGTDGIDLITSLKNSGYLVNPTVESFYKDNKASGPARTTGVDDLDSGDTVILNTAETPQSMYTESVKNSYVEYSDAAFVVITRVGGEGFDLPRTMKDSSGKPVTGARNADDHYLQLDQNETDLLKAVCDSNKFSHVIVLLNSGSAMELGFLEDSSYYAYQEKIDGALWMGYPGAQGFAAVGEILNGNVNPSGKTVDTFSSDFKKDPTWNNFGDNRITGDPDTGVKGGDQYDFDDVDSNASMYYFVNYEEGEYVGYRYYETRGYTDGETWYNNNVVYPFGYGLSYTSFDWRLDNSSTISSLTKDEFTVEVEVENTGSVPGKDIVEIYATLPYTAGEIEKPYEVLAGYGKTEMLEPGEKDTVSITINPYYLASYDNNDDNNNGFKGYELEAGNYSFHINSDAHTKLASFDASVASDLRFDEDTVSNKYTDNEDETLNSDWMLNSVLSRNDWEGTWPSEPTDAERKGTRQLLTALQDLSENNPNDLESEEYPYTDEDNGMTLFDMTYDEEGNKLDWVDYDDPRWDDLLNQMNFSEALNMYNLAAYEVKGVKSVGLPRIICGDGTAGWTSFVNKDSFKKCTGYCSSVITAQTWNVDLIEELGNAVGEEGLVGDGAGTPTPYSGWYAPGTNIHRSPFGGRNFEYYSEDSLLAGKSAAAQIKGCRERGTVTYLKHFALNEQETHRSITGDITWVSEQQMREIYLRPFEIAVKEGKTTGMMSSFNRIGTRWTGGDYRLMTGILREEWGFKGSVICDFNTIPQYMDAKQEAYAGGDLNLATLSSSSWKNADESSTSDLIVLRNALKNVCYSFVNSNAMKGIVIGTRLSKWEIVMIIADVTIPVAVVLWGGLYIGLALRKIKNENPEDLKQ